MSTCLGEWASFGRGVYYQITPMQSLPHLWWIMTWGRVIMMLGVSFFYQFHPTPHDYISTKMTAGHHLVSKFGNDMKKKEEFVEVNGSWRTVWKQCWQSPWGHQTQTVWAKESVRGEIQGFRVFHDEFWGDECRPKAYPLGWAFISEEFILTSSDSKDFFSHRLQRPSHLGLIKLRTEATLVSNCPVASVYPHKIWHFVDIIHTYRYPNILRSYLSWHALSLRDSSDLNV